MLLLAALPLNSAVAEARPGEPLSAVVALGRITPEDLKGREVFNDDELLIGVVHDVAAHGRSTSRLVAFVALDSGLDVGEGCIAAPLDDMREAPEGRVLLHIGSRRLRVAERWPCKP